MTEHTECQPNSCLVSAVYEGASEPIPLSLLGLSLADMFIHTPEDLPAGSVLKLRLLLSGRKFLLRSEVRHCIRGQGAIVEFVDPPPDALLAMEESMNQRNSAACVFFPPTADET